MNKKKLICVLLGIILMIWYFMPQSLSKAIGEDISSDSVRVLSFEVINPGAFSGDYSYKISEEGLKMLIDDFKSMKVIRNPFSVSLKSTGFRYTTVESISMVLIHNEEKKITLRAFDDILRINGKKYLMINQSEKLFGDLRSKEKKEIQR